MNHLKWMGHTTTIFDIQRHLRNDPDSCDVKLVASGRSVRAHRFVLSSCSDLLRNLLADVPIGQESTIVVPDIKGYLLDSVLAFIYMGETSLTSTNLSEFLEAINILGIKSAISFDVQQCSNAAVPSSPSVGMPVKTMGAIEMGHEELMETDMVEQKNESQNVIVESPAQSSSTRDLEFLDVYAEPQHKITYSIEHIPGSASGNEFILTENSGTFTLTQNAAAKLENASSAGSTADKIDEVDEEEDEEEDDGDADGIIEDYSSSGAGEHIIEIAAANAAVATAATITSSSSPTAAAAVEASVIELKPPKIEWAKINNKMKTIKLKTVVASTTGVVVGGDPNCSSASSSALGQFETLKVESFSSAVTAATSFNDSGGRTVGAGAVSSPNDDTLDLAVQAVLDEGMSLQKAAHKYDISKTVLWRRVRKHPNYMKTTRENPVLSLAYERLKGGNSLKSISRELDIPMSTLHRHKVRLASQGRLPDYVTFKKRDSISKEELKEKLAKAVHACVHEGMSQNHAANLFNIPKSTLWRHLQKRVAEAELSESMSVGGHIKEEVILS